MNDVKVWNRKDKRCEHVRPSLDGTFVWVCTNLQCDGVEHYMVRQDVAA